ncbi:MAG: domain S-box, partial [Noviherbaspirillum sp.]|nr:domain S-box [Noviherbaspirillum sp.]
MKQGDDPLSEDNASALGALIFESSPDCMNLLDPDGNIAAVNRNGRCLMEIDDFRTVAGLSWQSLWPEASHADIRMALADARGGGTGRFSAYGPTAKGAPKWWDVIVTPVRARNGQIERLLAVSRDVTAAHQASLELQASEARFRSLVTATSAIVWCASASGQFETEQASWAAFTGQTPEQYKGWRWLDAVHPGDQAQTLATWRQAVETHSLYQVEHRLRCADGQYRHMLARAVPIVDAAGNISEWVGVHTDISTRIQANAERERLLKEVQASNNRLLDVFRQAPAFMCVFGGPDHVFEMINERYFQLVGNRDLVGQPVRQALPEIEGQGFFELLDRVFQTGEPFMGVDMPVRLKRSPGSTLEERFIDFVFMALRDADGSVTGLLVHGVDQT